MLGDAAACKFPPQAGPATHINGMRTLAPGRPVFFTHAYVLGGICMAGLRLHPGPAGFAFVLVAVLYCITLAHGQCTMHAGLAHGRRDIICQDREQLLHTNNSLEKHARRGKDQYLGPTVDRVFQTSPERAT